MTPADIDAALPNGFHDAVLCELHVEFARRELRLVFDFFVGEPDAETEEGREAMRPGLLRLGGVTSMLVEPPDPRYAFTAISGVRVTATSAPIRASPCRPTTAWFDSGCSSRRGTRG